MGKKKSKWIFLDTASFDDGSRTIVKLRTDVELPITASHAVSSSYVPFDGVDGLSSFSSSLTNAYISESGQDVTLGEINATNFTGSLDFSDLDNVPDFVLESETSSMSVSTASYIDYTNVDNVPDFVLESETSSMSVLSAETASCIDYSNVKNHPDFVLESETSSMSVATASYVDYNNIDNIPLTSSTTVDTASYVDWPNVDNVPDFVLESETSSMSVLSAETASCIDYSNVKNHPDFVLESETSSMSVATASYIDYNNIDNIPLTSSMTVATASYVDWPNVDNVPDFVLESETSSMSVLSAQTASCIDYTNVKNHPDFVLESETSSMSVLHAQTASYVAFDDVEGLTSFSESIDSRLNALGSGSFVFEGYEISEQTVNLTTTSGTPVIYHTFITQPLDAGDYFLIAVLNFSKTKTNNNLIIDVKANGISLNTEPSRWGEIKEGVNNIFSNYTVPSGPSVITITQEISMTGPGTVSGLYSKIAIWRTS